MIFLGLVLLILITFFAYHTAKSNTTIKKYKNALVLRSDDKELLFKNNQAVSLITSELGNRISIFNSYDAITNAFIAERIILITILTNICLTIFFLFYFDVWYIAVFSSLAMIIAAMLLLLIFTSYSKLAFSKHLPSTFRITEKRITKYNSIIKVLEYCLEFYPKPIRNEMVRVINALDQNAKSITESQLADIMKRYNNKYFNLFISMIYDAHFDKTENVAIQFANISKEMKIVQVRLENMYSLVNMWIVVLTLMALSIFGVPYIIGSFLDTLGGSDASYFGSAEGYMIKLATLIFYLLSVLMLMNFKKVD